MLLSVESPVLVGLGPWVAVEILLRGDRLLTVREIPEHPRGSAGHTSFPEIPVIALAALPIPEPPRNAVLDGLLLRRRYFFLALNLAFFHQLRAPVTIDSFRGKRQAKR